MQKETFSKLYLSIISSGILGVSSIIFGWFFHTSVIILDGFFTIVGTVMAAIMLFVAKYIEKEDFKNFPFGKDVLSPLILLINNFVLLLIALVGITQSVETLLFHSYDEINYLIGGLYTLFSIVYCLFILKKLKKGTSISGMLQLEIRQWRFGLYFSVSILVSYLIALLLAHLHYETLAQTIDPVVTLFITGYFIFISIREIKAHFREVLSGTPSLQIRQEIVQVLEQRITQRSSIEESILRTAKVGDSLIIELDIVISPESTLDSILVQDQLRSEVIAALEEIYPPHQTWLSITFTADKRFAY
ncbi:cation transporter [Enterococcus sp. LJL98]